MAEFLKYGETWVRKDEKGAMFPVVDRDTIQGLKTGQLPYRSEGINRPLYFAPEDFSPGGLINPSGAKFDRNTGNPIVENAPTGSTSSADLGSLIKQKLISALTNYQGVTNTAELETRRQTLLRQQLLSSPYSPEGESTLTGAQKLSLLRNKGTEFEPELKSLEEQILKAKQGDQNALDSLTKLTSLAKDAGIFGVEEKHSPIYYEWKDAQASGYKGTLNEYANMDANRRKSVTNIMTDSGMNSKQVATFNSLVDKQNKSPLVAAADRTIVVDTVAEQLKKDPKNSSLQLSFIYSFIQMLDTYQSAVREGEIGIMSGTQGLGDKLANIPDKISQGTILSTSVINQYIATAKMLSNSIKAEAKKKKSGFASQAKVSGIENAWKEYSAGLDTEQPKTPVTIRVKRKKDGATGTINADEYDPSLYTKI